MKLGKRILALILAVCLLGSSAPLSVFATDNTEQPPVEQPPVDPAGELPVDPVVEPTPEPTPEPAPEPVPEPTPEPTPVPEAAARFSVLWGNAPHSGAAVDVSSDVVITLADGTPVENYVTYFADGAYTVTGLQYGADYVISLLPGAEKGYYVLGESSQALVADGMGAYVTAAPFALSYSTYDLVMRAAMPEGQSFAPALSLGGISLPVTMEQLEDGSFRIAGLYHIDGDYQLTLPQIAGTYLPGGYSYTVNAAAASLNIEYRAKVNVAEFDVYWKDNSNATGRRTLTEMKDMIEVHTVTGGVVSESALENIDITAEPQEHSELPGFEKVTYTVHGLPELGEGSELELKWVELPAPLPGYEGAYSEAVKLVEWFDPLRLTRNETGLYTGEKAYAFTLPEYEVILRVNGLNETAIAEFMAGVKVSRYDYNTDSYADFGAFWTERSGSDIRVRGLYQSDSEGFPEFYNVTWPEKIANFSLPEEAQLSLEAAPAMSFFAAGNGGNTMLLAELNYFETLTTVTPSGTSTSYEDIVWYDPNNDYAHQGELIIEVPVTIGEKTITFKTHPAEGETDVLPLTWDPAQQAYIHDWTLDDLKKFDTGLSDSELSLVVSVLADLKVTDTGENNLNRLITATTTEKVELVTSQYYQEIGRKSVNIAVGDITVTGTTYTPAEDAAIREYQVGTSQYKGENVTTFYSMVDVTFNVDFRNGDDPVSDEVIQAALANVKLYNMNVRTESGEGSGSEAVADQVASENFPEEYGFNYNIQSTISGSVDAYGDGSFTVRLPLFRPNKTQADYAISCDEYHPEGLDYYYRVEHDNTLAPGHGTDILHTYADGTLILIRTGDTDFNFTKVWADEGTAEVAAERPAATYTLWRYSTNGGDYTSASMVEIPLRKEGNVIVNDADNHGDIPTGYTEGDTDSDIESVFAIRIPLEAADLELLDKYDAEGYPYIYFVREDISGGNNLYTKIYGSVSADGQTITPNPLPENYPYDNTANKQNSNDSAIYDDGVITNRRSDYSTVSVSKSWTAAYYQDSFDTLSVEMQLWAQHADGSGEPYEVGDPVILRGFDAFNPSKSASKSVNLFDNNGHPLKFWWEEVSVTETRNGTVVKTTPVNYSTEDLTDTDTTNDPDPVDYELQLNADTIAKDGTVPNSDENFEVSATVNGSSTHFANRLEGVTEYWVKKSWDPSMTKRDVTFVLYAFDKDGGLMNLNVEFTLKADSPYYSLSNGFESVWIDAFKDLPLYDPITGNRYSYIVKEKDDANDNIFPLSSYNKDPDEDGTNEPNSVYIHNAPVGDDEIEVRKVWLDDSATTDRAPVYYNIYTADGRLLYGTENGNTGLISANPVTVDDSFNWMETVNVTLYKKTVTDELTGSTTDLYIGSEAYLELSTEEKLAWDRQDTNGFYIREVTVGTSPVLTDAANLTAAGYSTVTYGSTKYAVIYNKDGKQSSQYTNSIDEDGFYTVTNLRIGSTNLQVEKIWKDDGSINREGFEASMSVSCTDDAERVKTGNGSDTVNGYAKVHTAVDASGWVAITDAAGTQIPVKQYLTGESDNETITYYNLPLYDETGKILHYTINEVVTRLPGVENPEGSYRVSSSGLHYSDGVASEHLGVQTVTNVFQHTEDVAFNLLWLDEYRVQNKQRPDMYLTLYHTVYDANGVARIEPYGFEEYLWGGEKNQKITEDFWRYTFHNMPMYDSNGRRITYYATVSTHVNSTAIDYLAPQYAKDGFVSHSDFMDYEEFMVPGINKATVTPSGTFYTVSHAADEDGVVGFAGGLAVMAEENTFVLQLKDDVTVEGHKVWERVPVGFPAAHLPLLNFRLQRSSTDYADELDAYLNRSSEYSIASILNYQSPTTDFSYKMLFVGINNYDYASGSCTLVPKTDIITYADPEGVEHTETALKAWMRHAGLDPAKADEVALAEKYYGTELPQYNGKGEMYTYTMLESWIKPDKDSYINNRVDLESSINEYNIVNTVRSDTRPIQATKEFLYNGSRNLPEDFLYPALEFTLSRFVKLDALTAADGTVLEPARYSEPEDVKTITLTGSQVKAIAEGDDDVFVDFGQQDIYAPNGNPFIYVVGEKVIGGYNNVDGDEYPVISITGHRNNVTAETNVTGWPSLTETSGNWYSAAFTIDVYKYEGANIVVDPTYVMVELDNNYTAMEQTSVPGSKTWNDYNNFLGTRPDELNLQLWRKVTAPGQGSNGGSKTIDEHFADIVLRSDGTHSIELVEDAENLTSSFMDNEVTISSTSTGSVWGFRIANLDKYATNAVQWVYYVKEVDTVPGYTQSISNNTYITNDLRRTFEVFKQWEIDDGSLLNEELLFPDVELKLQVRAKNGPQGSEWSSWRDAATAFGTSLGASYEYNKVLGHPHWRHIYQNLPVGVQIGSTYYAFEYRVQEVRILTADETLGTADIVVNNNDYGNGQSGNGSFGNGKYTASVTLKPNGKDFLVNNTTTDTQFTVRKVWVDSNNGYDLRNVVENKWTVSFNVYREFVNDNGETVSEPLTKTDGSQYVMTVTGTGKTDNEGSATISDLPAFAPNGSAYTYYAVELNPDGTEISNKRYYGAYDAASEQSKDDQGGDVTTYTNTLILTEVAVTKLWAGDVIAQEIPFRPDDIELTLKRGLKSGSCTDFDKTFVAVNGAEPEWTQDNANNKWTASYVNLPKFNNSGVAYVYEVVEATEPQTGYRLPIYTYGPASSTDLGYPSEGNTTTATITNTATKFYMDKVDADDTSAQLNGVTLKWRSSNLIGGNYWFLTWSRSADGTESYEIRYGTNKDTPTAFSHSDSAAAGTKVAITGLPEGTYVIVDEPIVPNGYWPSALGSNRSFTLDSSYKSNDKTVVYQTISENTSKFEGSSESANSSEALLKVLNHKTDLTIQKLGTISGQSSAKEIPSGWKFEISGKFLIDEAIVEKTLPYPGTDFAGKLIVGEAYTMQETENPDGFKLDSTVLTFTLDKTNKPVFSGSPSQVTVSSKEENNITVYTVKFTDAPFSMKITKNVKNTDGSAGTALADAQFKLEKKAPGDANWSPVSGKTDLKSTTNGLTIHSVEWKNSKVTPVFVTGESAATATHYRITETAAPNGYRLLDTAPSFEFWFNEAGQLQPVSRGTDVTASNQFLDRPIELTLYKYDDGDYLHNPAKAEKKALSGVSFTIQEVGTSRKATVTTDSEGRIDFGPFGSGKGDDFMLIGGKSYTLTETAEPGYQKLPVITFAVATNGTVSFTSGQPADSTLTGSPDDVGGQVMKLYNDRVLGKVTITKATKIDGKDYELEDVIFHLYMADEPVTWWDSIKDLFTGTSYKLVWTSDNQYSSTIESESTGDGKLVIENLPWGTYKLVEFEGPDGFKWEEKEFEFTIEPQNLQQHVTVHEKSSTIYNNRFSFSFFKHAKTASGGVGKGVAGAVFKAQKWDGSNWVDHETQQNMTSDSNGKVELHSIIIKNNNPVVIFESGDSVDTAPRYRIVETVQPNGYLLPVESKAYTEFWFDRDGDIHYTESGSDVADDNKFLDIPIEIELVKFDEGDIYDQPAVREVLSNVTFTISEKDANPARSATLKTDGNGKIKFGPDEDYYLNVGKTYTLTESPKAGYETLPAIQFTVNADGTVSFVGTAYNGEIDESGKKIELTNDRKRGSVTLTKYYSNTSNTLNGAKFDLYQDGEKVTWYNGSFETGTSYALSWNDNSSAITAVTPTVTNDGKLSISGLPWGSYELKEVLAPDGYKTETVSKSFAIGPVKDKMVLSVNDLAVENTPFEFSFTKHAITKRGTAGEKLNGAEFIAQYQDESGNWKPLETQQSMTSVNGSVTLKSVVLDAANKSVVIFENGESADTAPHYRIVEKTAPAGYILPDNAYMEFWFDRDGALQPVERSSDVTADNEFLDKPLEISLVKYDAGDIYATSNPRKTLSNVQFTITEVGTNRSAQVSTDKDGMIKFGPDEEFYLIGGKSYTLTETPVAGYVTLPDITFDVSTDGTISYTGTNINVSVTEDDTQLELINERKRGQVTLSKYVGLDGTEYGLDGAAFELYHQDVKVSWFEKFFTGTTYTLVWDSSRPGADQLAANAVSISETGDGKLVITNLPWGTYKLVEVLAPNGYVTDTTIERSFTIDARNIAVDLTLDAKEVDKVENKPFEFSVYKNADSNGKAGAALDIATFEAQYKDENGNWQPLDTKQAMTTVEGTLTLSSVVPGINGPEVIFENGESAATAPHYRMVEKIAPAGYILPADAYLEFWFDRDGELQPIARSANVTAKYQFLDKPLEISLVKYDEGDAYAEKTPLAGVSFTITEVGSTRTATVTTNGDGLIEFGPDKEFYLIGGKSYTLVETAKPGYETLPTIRFSVGTDGIITLDAAYENASIVDNGLELINDRKRGQVTLTKYATLDGSEYELEGAVFELYHADEPVTWWEQAKEFFTGTTYTLVWSADSSTLVRTEEDEVGGGKLVIKDLPWGTYKLVEVLAADGYKTEQVESEPFTIDPQNLAASVTIDHEQVRVENKPFTFSFSKNIKTDSGKAGDLLDTAAFKAEYQDENGEWQPLDTRQTMTTANGMVTLQSVVAVEDADGTLSPVVIFRTGDDAETAPHYRITETVAPHGYILPDAAPSMEFWFDRSGTLQPIARSGVTANNEFLDAPLKIKLVKFDEGDAYAVKDVLAGVSFTVTEVGTNRSKVVTTDDRGEIAFGPDSENDDFMLIGGKTYTLTETPKPGYVTLPEITVAVDENGTVSFVGEAYNAAITENGKQIELINDRKRGQVTLTKYATLDGSEYELEGASFELYRADEPVTWWEQTKQFFTGTTYTLVWSADSQTLTDTEELEVGDGKLVIRNLPWGTYKLVEVLAADGYKTEAVESEPFTIDPQNLDVTAELDLEEVSVENKPFEFSFTKNEMLRLTHAGDLLDTATFKAEYLDENGAWQPLDTRQTMTTTDGSVTLKSVVVEDNAPVVIFRTGDSVATAPHYRITETVAPHGYILPDAAPSMEFWFDRSGTLQPIARSGVTANNEFLDEPLKIKLVKFDEGDFYAVKDVLAGVSFTITEVDTNRSKVVTTDENGEIAFGPDSENDDFMLIGGKTYTLVETPKPGYVTLPEITVAVDENGTVSFVGEAYNAAITENGKQIELINDRKRGQVTLTKYMEDTEIELSGAVFELYHAEEPVTWWDKFFTGTTYELIWSSDSTVLSDVDTSETEDGKLVITNLPWGTYKLVEIQAPNGFKLEERELEFTIDPQNLAVEVEMDYETGELYNSNFNFSFYKNVMDEDGKPGESLSGAVFEAWVWDSKLNDWAPLDTKQTMVTDNGIITLESVVIEDGEATVIFGNGDSVENAPLYRITEKVAPAGYIRPDDIPYMTFWFDRSGALHLEDYSADVTANCEFLDCPIELILVKYDGGDRGTDVKYNFADPATFDPANYEKLLKLENITFTLSGSDGSEQQTAITNDSGIITMGPEGEADFAVIGGVTYTLTEEDVTGRGYTTILPFTFTVKQNGEIELPSGTPGNATIDENATTLRLVNDRILGSVALYKHTVDNSALNGITFELYRLDTPNSFREKLLAFVTGTSYVLDETFDWKGTEEGDFKYDFEILDDGYLRISGLDWGQYKLVETVADGYVLSRDESKRTFPFEIGPDNIEEDIFIDQDLDVLNIPNEVLVRKVDLDDPDFNPLVGAEYKLYHNTVVDGENVSLEITNTTDPMQPMWVWDKESGTGKATRLSTGDYTLVETWAPSGYTVALPFNFHMDEYGTVTSDDTDVSVYDELPLLFARDRKTVFRFNKSELYNESCFEAAEATRALAGVTFTAYYDEALTQVICEATSDENGVVSFYGLPLKDYLGEGTETPVYIRETATAPGHVLDENTYAVYVDCYVDEKGELVDNSTLLLVGENGMSEVENETIVNDVHRAGIEFTKVSELDHGKVIPGAVYGLYKTTSYTVAGVSVPFEIKVAEAVADANGRVAFSGLLMDVDYTIRELSVPTGSYVSAAYPTFRFTWTDGAAVLSMVDDGDVLVTENDRLIWLEPQTIVAIRKITSKGMLLKGATLQILDSAGNPVPVIDASGNTVTRWISGEEAYVIAGQLKAGDTYWLHEIEAPAGYLISKDVKFTIPNVTVKPGEMKIIDVYMRDYHISEVPKTGDETPLAIYASVFGVSSLGLAFLLLSKKRRSKS